MIKIYEQYALKYNYYSTVILKKIDLIRGNFLIVEVLVSFENNSWIFPHFTPWKSKFIQTNSLSRETEPSHMVKAWLLLKWPFQKLAINYDT